MSRNEAGLATYKVTTDLSAVLYHSGLISRMLYVSKISFSEQHSSAPILGR